MSKLTLALGAAAAIAAIVIVAAVVASGGGNDSIQAVAVATPTTQSQPAAAGNPTVAPTQTPVATAQPGPTEAPPAPTTPPPAPTAEPQLPDRTSCAEIRADPVYRTDAEREFFIRDCTGPAAPAATSRPGGAPLPTTAPPGDQSAVEKAYVTRATAVIGYYTARLAQHWNQPVFGATRDLYELASLALGNANDLDNIRPVPDAFREAHDGYVRALLALHDQIIPGLPNRATFQQFVAWVAGYERRASDASAALRNYLQVTGIQAPQLGGLR